MSTSVQPATQFTHRLEDGIETYEFPTALNTKQGHFIDRVDDGPWEICLVDTNTSLTLDDAVTLKAELEELISFMIRLNGTELHRNTEPGQPEHEEGI